MAKAKNSLAKAKDIRAGKSYWIIQHSEPRKITVSKRSHTYIEYDYCDVIRATSLSDRGVIGLAYDKRPTQLFNNRRSAEYWYNHYSKQFTRTKFNMNFFERGIHN